jgi:hypothetical protein
MAEIGQKPDLSRILGNRLSTHNAFYPVMSEKKISGKNKTDIGVRAEDEIAYTSKGDAKKRTPSERELDIRELKYHYRECLSCMEYGERYSDDLLNLQAYIGYCLGRTVNVIPEGSIPKRAPISQLAYARCIGQITSLLLTTGLLEEMLDLDCCEEIEDAVFDE